MGDILDCIFQAPEMMQMHKKVSYRKSIWDNMRVSK